MQHLRLLCGPRRRSSSLDQISGEFPRGVSQPASVGSQEPNMQNAASSPLKNCAERRFRDKEEALFSGKRTPNPRREPFPIRGKHSKGARPSGGKRPLLRCPQPRNRGIDRRGEQRKSEDRRQMPNPRCSLLLEGNVARESHDPATTTDGNPTDPAGKLPAAQNRDAYPTASSRGRSRRDHRRIRHRHVGDPRADALHSPSADGPCTLCRAGR